MIKTEFIKDTVVVGAGMAGLALSYHLSQAWGPQGVLILDKGRGVGGRLAHRRFESKGLSYEWDHGAPDFEVVGPQLNEISHRALGDGVLKALPNGAPNAEPMKRYMGKAKMTDFPKWLGRGLNILPSHQVESIELSGGHGAPQWILGVRHHGDHHRGGGQLEIRCRSLIVTAPAPQILRLLEGVASELPQEVLSELRAIDYSPSIVLLLAMKRSLSLEEDEKLKPILGDLFKHISDQQKKGVSPSPSMVFETSSSWAEAHLGRDLKEVEQELMNSLPVFLKDLIVSPQIHVWRYARARNFSAKPFLFVDKPAPLGLCGDGFSKRGGVEGSFDSGWALAETLISQRG